MKTHKINPVSSPTLTGPRNCFSRDFESAIWNLQLKRFLTPAKTQAVTQFGDAPFCILQFAFCIKRSGIEPSVNSIDTTTAYIQNMRSRRATQTPLARAEGNLRVSKRLCSKTALRSRRG